MAIDKLSNLESIRLIRLTTLKIPEDIWMEKSSKVELHFPFNFKKKYRRSPPFSIFFISQLIFVAFFFLFFFDESKVIQVGFEIREAVLPTSG